MNEAEFDQLADTTLAAIEDAIEDCDADIDYDTAGGILTLEFANASQIIINKQAALSQIWVAARSGGFHFDYEATSQSWCLHGKGNELFDCLSQYCSEQSGAPVVLTR